MITTILLYAIPLFLLSSLTQSYLRLRHIPGPFLARFTDLWRLLSVYNRQPHETQLLLHRKHGDVVRLGPDCVSICGPNYSNQIYGIGKGFVKSDYYSVFQNVVNGRRAASLVAMTDETTHAKTKRQVAHAYSLSTLVEFEPLVDSTIKVFLEQLSLRYASATTTTSRSGGGGSGGGGEAQSICDFGQYLQFFAFDVIGELTFSKRLGFIETNSDVDSIIAAIGANFRYFSVLGQMPWLDTWLGKNPLYIKYFAKPVGSPILRFAQNLLSERLRETEGGVGSTTGEKGQEEGEEEDAERVLRTKPDFLSRFLAASKKGEREGDEEMTMTDRQLLSFLFANINAGSDTIASTLRAIFYHLLTNRESLKKLLDELDLAKKDGYLTLPVPKWSETQSQEHVPYLQAVVKEGLRMNPALSLPLERVVPGPEGLTLHPEGEKEPVKLPPGTVVGINPWVQHRDPRIFSPQPDDEDEQVSSLSSSDAFDTMKWNPDRFLTKQELANKTMEHSLLSFGAGKRSCLGKNIAMLELHKLIPAVLMRFRLELVDPSAWTVRNAWVLEQSGLRVRIAEREKRQR